MVFRICTYQTVHFVSIFGLNENLCTVFQNSCSKCQTTRAVKPFEKGLLRT